ncbi:MAG: 16S rRNA (guanine(966)-N(2))-methyltransferase RsmD [Bacteroidia bacterium]
MRIISGKHKGKIIKAPENLPVRPTTDFAKTGLFNMINFRYKFEKITALDLFAGTGNISFEFISRHCNSVIAVEENADCVKFIKKIFTDLKTDLASVSRADVFEYLKNCTSRFDIIFADPPFELKNYHELIAAVFEKNLLNPKGTFILEHHSKNHFTDHTYFSEERKYGNVSFTFFAENKS